MLIVPALAMVLLLGSPGEPGQAVTAPATTIIGLEISIPLGMEDRGFAGLIEARAGTPFSRDIVDQDITRLLLTGKFKDIQVQTRYVTLPGGGTGVTIVYQLTPKTLIREIRIAGNQSLSRDGLLSILGLWEGAEFRGARDPAAGQSTAVREDLDRWTAAVKEAYRKIGFPRAEVTFKVEPLDDAVRLIVSIAENYPLLAADISLQGDLAFPEPVLREKIRLAPGHIITDALLEESVHALREMYTHGGYWAASIPKPAVTPLASGMDARVIFTIRAGDKYTVTFTGNKYQALEEFIDLEGGIAVDFWAEEMERHYRNNGFLNARVTPSIIPHPESGTKEIVFAVTEGERVRLVEIRFHGNAHIGTDELLSRIATRTYQPFWSLLEYFFSSEKTIGVYTEEKFREDIKAILFEYQRRGHLEAKVEDIKLDFAPGRDISYLTVTVFIEEGTLTTLEDIEVIGAHTLPREAILSHAALSPNTPLDLYAVEMGKKAVTDYYKEQGYPSARAETRVEINRNGTRAKVVYTVTEGPRYTVGKIIVQGTDKTKDYVVTRELSARPGDPYTQDALVEAQQRLTKLGYFDRVSLSAVDRGDVRDILIKVQEGNTAHASIGAGYGNVDGIRGFLELGEKNITGRGRGVSLRLDGADDVIRYARGVDTFQESINEERITLGYREPHLFRTEIKGRVDLIHEYQNRRYVGFQIRKNSGIVGMEYGFTQNVKTVLLYEFEIRRLTGAIITTTGDQGLLQLGVLTPILIYDIRDDPFNPRRGQIVSLQAEVAEAAVWSKESFIKGMGKWGWFNPIVDDVVGSFVVRAGYGVPYRNSQSIPLERRFFTGGANSVRGFVEDSIGPQINGNPIGGNILLNFSLEARAPLWGKLGLAVFTDWGNVWEDANRFAMGRLDDIRKSAGFGIRYNTPIGPLRVDLGCKLDRRGDEPLLGFHFFIGNAF